ncbi:DgyrCDS7977 [Dimorphilus gyrociliatus]|uniref:DgyrCDS7977 n=1 Tax=Dimorphilus gyrociliatus TaxID=2664684 RepID=A0A7I8VV10_9ANNE|nr:DgyrCDS7977 [Dimorphilus gyrociliatus]
MDKSKLVQRYLERHRIGPLFEELMGRIVNDKPEEPLPYLIRLIQKRQDRSSTAAMLRKSTSDLHHIKRETTASKVGKSLTLSKSTNFHPKPKSPTTRQQKPDWDNSTKVKSLDDLWGSPDERKENGFTPDEDLYISRGYAGPVVKDDEDSLEAELNILKYRKTKEKTTAQKQPVVSYAPTTAKGRLALQEKRRRKIESLRKKDEKDSGYEDNKDLTINDDALELYENADDLRSEGIKVKGSRGVKIAPTSIPRNESQVRVSVCARCARVMTGEPSEDVCKGGFERYTSDTDLDSRVDTPAKFTTDFEQEEEEEEEEEFESVSQVTGPRKPVWTDDEDKSARRSKTMLRTTIPHKGKPMYFNEEIASARSTPRKSERSTKSKMRQTWAPGVQNTDSDEEENQRGWRVVDNDSDASITTSRSTRNKPTRSSFPRNRDKTVY